MKFTFIINLLADAQQKSMKDHDKYVHFVWGYFINFVIIMVSVIFYNEWVGLGICFIMVLCLEYFQKRNGGINSKKEQIMDIIAGFITAPVWAWLIPQVFN